MIKKIKKIIFFVLQFFVKKKISTVHQNGIEFKVETQDKLGESWNLINNYDLSEFQIFEKTNASEIKLVHYYGCHQCIIPIKIQKIFLPDSQFFCFEAIKKNYQIGLSNIKLNNCEEKIKILNEAISTKNGFEYFDYFSLNSFKTKKSILSRKVKSSNIENICERFGKPDLIYMDIEGLEGMVIENSIKYLKSWKNTLFIESHGDETMGAYNYSNIKLYNLLMENNYSLYQLNQNYMKESPKFKKIESEKEIPNNRYYLLAKTNSDF